MLYFPRLAGHCSAAADFTINAIFINHKTFATNVYTVHGHVNTVLFAKDCLLLILYTCLQTEPRLCPNVESYCVFMGLSVCMLYLYHKNEIAFKLANLLLLLK